MDPADPSESEAYVRSLPEGSGTEAKYHSRLYRLSGFSASIGSDKRQLRLMSLKKGVLFLLDRAACTRYRDTY